MTKFFKSLLLKLRKSTNQKPPYRIQAIGYGGFFVDDENSTVTLEGAIELVQSENG